MKIKKLDLPDNCTLVIHSKGIDVWVSVNIPKELISILPKENVFKSDKFHVFACKRFIPAEFQNSSNIEYVYRKLLNQAMFTVRKYKAQMLKSQMENIRIQHQMLVAPEGRAVQLSLF